MNTSLILSINTMLREWAEVTLREHNAFGVFVFGSLVYRNGEQFGEDSDIDLVVILPEIVDAVERVQWLESFVGHKINLEMKLVQLLRRKADRAIVSILAVTKAEISMDVHKDGHRQFFEKNKFLDLRNGQEVLALPGAGTVSSSRFSASAFAFTQKIRNEYFSVSFNTQRSFEKYDGPEPLPKRFMRAGAMANQSTKDEQEPGAEYDLRVGLDMINYEISDRVRRGQLPYKQIEETLSIRRGGRGQSRSLEILDQLLISEIIYDVAYRAFASSIKTADEMQALPPMPYHSSLVFFEDRFRSAFPGVRSISWYNEKSDISQRMNELLKAPLIFQGSTPIWWWRSANMRIENFQVIDQDIFLMNIDELDIASIAACPGKSYKWNFVYVELRAMEPSGLYPKAEKLIRNVNDKDFQCICEEFGLFEGKKISRSEYDDGAAVVDGVLQQTQGRSELRARHVTPYNFIIAPQESPINNPDFDQILENFLNQALRKNREKYVADLKSAVDKLPLLRQTF